MSRLASESSARRRSRLQQRMLPRPLQVASIVLLCAFALAPVAFMLISSVSPDIAVASGDLFPDELAFGNYVELWSTLQLANGLVNSLVVSLSAAVLATAFAVGTAYCLVRFTFVGRRSFLRSLLGLQTIPSALLLLPLFVVFFSVDSYLGIQLVGTRTGMVITYLTFALPFATWVMVTYLRTIPLSLEEAGLIDGLTRFGVLWRIVVPLAFPGMVVATIFSFLLGWNDVLFASILSSPRTRTAAMQLSAFAQSQEGGAIPLYGQLMGASVVCAVPVVVLYLVFQRYLVGGLTSGGVKG